MNKKYEVKEILTEFQINLDRKWAFDDILNDEMFLRCVISFFDYIINEKQIHNYDGSEYRFLLDFVMFYNLSDRDGIPFEKIRMAFHLLRCSSFVYIKNNEFKLKKSLLQKFHTKYKGMIIKGY